PRARGEPLATDPGADRRGAGAERAPRRARAYGGAYRDVWARPGKGKRERGKVLPRSAPRGSHNRGPPGPLPAFLYRGHRGGRSDRPVADRGAAEPRRAPPCAAAVGLEPRPQAHGPPLVQRRVVPRPARMARGAAAGVRA